MPGGRPDIDRRVFGLPMTTYAVLFNAHYELLTFLFYFSLKHFIRDVLGETFHIESRLMH